ncbi:phospholipase D-like domain-containing protein [Corallococcus sp. BB11-1]|uniref:phospholipase D-like domain-containing protein n=1 Tax=Corallococcus sp. BB11-1 TaxID=2996783 RepID=UPI00226E546A|nr:phospholipase D-like domain-containing protein [Corallococcus sp. BB11-1]MCY1036589.1 phospholipase D-like domain-containing protein [Corallococcus sp. BB11-1]
MRPEWFAPMVRGWSEQVRWEPGELERATGLLVELSRAQGGALVLDEAPGEDVARQFALRRAREVLQRRMNRYARALEEGAGSARYSRPVREASDTPALPFVTPHEWADALEVNTASAEELEGLPGLGRGLAGRIVRHRRAHGPFRTLESLLRVEGLGVKGLEQLRGRILLEERPPVFRSEALEAFVQEPSFARYVQWVAASGGSFQWRRAQGQGPVAQVLMELEEALRDAREHPCGVARRLGATRASAARTEQERLDRARAHAEDASGPVRAGVLLRQGQYPEFVERLLSGAARSVRVVLFFFRYVDAKYPTHGLLQQLIAAHERGVDVQVILDQDAKGDVYHSRIINLSAFQALTARKVPVRYDTATRLTHSKLVLVDGRHLVMGSHNWTLSSFTRYDETSLYLDSEPLGARLEERFQTLWTQKAQRDAAASPMAGEAAVVEP